MVIAMKGCRPLSDDEISLVYKNFAGRYQDRDRALFLLGVKSGFRISELLALTWADVMQNGEVLDRVRVQRRFMKKKLEGRTILLHPEARTALKIWLQVLGDPKPCEPIFTSQRGGALSRIQAWRILERVFEQCKLTGHLGTHSLRKTFANRVYDRLGNDLLKTQRALGHRNINSTVAYLSFREADIDEAILAI